MNGNENVTPWLGKAGRVQVATVSAYASEELVARGQVLPVALDPCADESANAGAYERSETISTHAAPLFY